MKTSLGIQETDPLRKDEIVVEEMPFNDQPVIEMSKQFDQQEKRQFWSNLAQKLTFPAMGLGLIGLFWRTMKRTRADDIPIGFPLGEISTNGNGNGNGHANGNGKSNGNGNGNGHYPKKGDLIPGVVTVDVLNQLIRENPANMTQAVRSWLARGKSVK